MMDGQREPVRRRYGEYTTADRTEIAVKVKAAEFNGAEFDGSPFSAMPEWLFEALREGKVVPHTRGSTDYAQWDVTTKRGVINAMPDDWIIRREKGDLSVVEAPDAFVLINLRPPVTGDHER